MVCIKIMQVYYFIGYIFFSCFILIIQCILSFKKKQFQLCDYFNEKSFACNIHLLIVLYFSTY